MKTVEQKRAANAMQRVDALKHKSREFKKDYGAYVNRLGPAIVMNGLGQALATELAAAGAEPKKDDAHAELYCSLQQWLCGPGDIYEEGDVLQAIVKNSEAHYVRAQAEALAWLEWHKKCCRASFPQDGGTER